MVKSFVKAVGFFGDGEAIVQEFSVGESGTRCSWNQFGGENFTNRGEKCLFFECLGDLGDNNNRL